MSVFPIISVICLFVAFGSVFGQFEVGERARYEVREFIDHRLPAAARGDGERVLSHLNDDLGDCEKKYYATNQWVGVYRECAGKALRSAMEDLGRLADNSWSNYGHGRSGASRPTLFW